MKNKPKKIFFISSTIYDLRKERIFINNFIKNYKTIYFSIDCIMSEFPDFPLSIKQIKSSHPYDICLQNIAIADFYIIILKKRYGYSNIKYGSDYISITHLEYLKACELNKPIFMFIDHRTWNALNKYNENKAQKWVSEKQIRLFDFINMIQEKKRKWITVYETLNDIRERILSSVFNSDHSIFIGGDITIPDGDIIPWIERKLIEINRGASGLLPLKKEILLPRTNPGQQLTIKVRFRAPYDEATCISKWKMVDKHGRYSFPRLGGIWCKIKAVRNIDVI
jgi:hypothetical protein